MYVRVVFFISQLVHVIESVHLILLLGASHLAGGSKSMVYLFSLNPLAHHLRVGQFHGIIRRYRSLRGLGLRLNLLHSLLAVLLFLLAVGKSYLAINVHVRVELRLILVASLIFVTLGIVLTVDRESLRLAEPRVISWSLYDLFLLAHINSKFKYFLINNINYI